MRKAEAIASGDQSKETTLLSKDAVTSTACLTDGANNFRRRSKKILDGKSTEKRSADDSEEELFSLTEPKRKQLKKIDRELDRLAELPDAVTSIGEPDSTLLEPGEERKLLGQHCAYRNLLKRAEKVFHPDHPSILKIKADRQPVRDRIINANVRLASNIAKKLSNRGVSYMDLYQSAIVGLLDALDRFDMEMNTRYATYATWWARRSVLLANTVENTSRAASIDPKLAGILSAINRFKEEFAKDHDLQEPPIEKIAWAIGTSVEIAQKLINITRVASLSVAASDGGTMEKNMSEGAKDIGNSFLDQETANSTMSDVHGNEMIETVHAALKKYLSPRERQVVIMMFIGYPKRGETWTLEKIGVKLKLSKESVRKIKLRSLKKLHTYCKETLAVLIDHHLPSTESA